MSSSTGSASLLSGTVIEEVEDTHGPNQHSIEGARNGSTRSMVEVTEEGDEESLGNLVIDEEDVEGPINSSSPGAKGLMSHQTPPHVPSNTLSPKTTMAPTLPVPTPKPQSTPSATLPTPNNHHHHHQHQHHHHHKPGMHQKESIPVINTPAVTSPTKTPPSALPTPDPSPTSPKTTMIPTQPVPTSLSTKAAPQASSSSIPIPPLPPSSSSNSSFSRSLTSVLEMASVSYLPAPTIQIPNSVDLLAELHPHPSMLTSRVEPVITPKKVMIPQKPSPSSVPHFTELAPPARLSTSMGPNCPISELPRIPKKTSPQKGPPPPLSTGSTSSQGNMQARPMSKGPIPSSPSSSSSSSSSPFPAGATSKVPTAKGGVTSKMNIIKRAINKISSSPIKGPAPPHVSPSKATTPNKMGETKGSRPPASVIANQMERKEGEKRKSGSTVSTEVPAAAASASASAEATAPSASFKEGGKRSGEGKFKEPERKKRKDMFAPQASTSSSSEDEPVASTSSAPAISERPTRKVNRKKAWESKVDESEFRKKKKLVPYVPKKHDPLMSRIHGVFWVKDHIKVGEEVMCHWKDGLNYTCRIRKIDHNRGLVDIIYDDQSKETVPLGWLYPAKAYDLPGSDLLCNWCKDGTSEEPNEIILCDLCNQGFHQKCHAPHIRDSVLEPNAIFYCRWCNLMSLQTDKPMEPASDTMKRVREAKTALPYELKDVSWDERGITNRQNRYCYCGGPGEPEKGEMYRCSDCDMWFHSPCLNPGTDGKRDGNPRGRTLFPGDGFYHFLCGVCRKTGTESFERKPMKWIDILSIALYNLDLSNPDKEFFTVNDIVSQIKLMKEAGIRLVKEAETGLSSVQIAARIRPLLMADQKTGKRFQHSSTRYDEWRFIRNPGDHLWFSWEKLEGSAPGSSSSGPSSSRSQDIPAGACRKSCAPHNTDNTGWMVHQGKGKKPQKRNLVADEDDESTDPEDDTPPPSDPTPKQRGGISPSPNSSHVHRITLSPDLDTSFLTSDTKQLTQSQLDYLTQKTGRILPAAGPQTSYTFIALRINAGVKELFLSQKSTEEH